MSNIFENNELTIANESLTFIEQMKQENEWSFDSRTLYRFDNVVVKKVMNMV